MESEPKTWAEVNHHDSFGFLNGLDDDAVIHIGQFLVDRGFRKPPTRREADDSNARKEWQDDLLGLGKINVNTGVLIRSNWAQSDTTKVGFDMDDTPRIDPTRREFVPESYLAQFHLFTNYEELHNGRAVLAAVMRVLKQKLEEMVCDNLRRLLPCEAAVSDVRNIVLGSEQQSDDALKSAAVAFQSSFASAQTATQELYGPIMDNKSTSDRYRRVLQIFDRYSYVFDLPLKMRRGVEPEEFDDIIRDFRKAKKWLEVQNNSSVIQKISADIDNAWRCFRVDLYKRLEDFSLPKSKLEAVVNLLEALEPGENHAVNVIASRKEKALRQMRVVLGQGAADVELRRNLVASSRSSFDVVNATAEQVKSAVKNADRVMRMLTDAFKSGLALYWDIATLVVEDQQEGRRGESVQLILTELLTNYAEGVRLTLLPEQYSGQALISRESALMVKEAYIFSTEIGISDDKLGPLAAIRSEVAESYAASVVRIMRIVAAQLGTAHPREPHELSDQIILLVNEALQEIEAVAVHGTKATRDAKNACIRTTVAAAKSLIALARDRADEHDDADTNNASEAKILNQDLIMASCCFQLRAVALPAIGAAVSEKLGPEEVDECIRKAERAVIEKEVSLFQQFTDATSDRLVQLVMRGVWAACALERRLPGPHMYTTELMLEFTLCVSTIQNAGLSQLCPQVCELLIRAVGKGYDRALSATKSLSAEAASQISCDVTYVEHALRHIPAIDNGAKGANGVSIIVSEAFAEARSMLDLAGGVPPSEADLGVALECMSFLHL